MIRYITLKILSIFDFFHQRKIIRFIKERKINEFATFFDVGAHKGESITLFTNNFKIKSMYSFEASPVNFQILANKINSSKKKFKNIKLIIENYAIGSDIKKVKLKQLSESSSSTIRGLNENSDYFKNKKILLQDSSKIDFFTEIEIDQITLSDYSKKNNIDNIDFIKIDTEGYELEVLKGAKDILPNTKMILFEHHYDDMIEKKYSFSDISDFLRSNNFEQIYKIKMPFRKTFEYIYINKHRN